MTPLLVFASMVEVVERTSYRQLPLVKLLRQIVDDQDQAALDEFHTQRSVFNHYDDGNLLMAEYLDRLRKNSREQIWGLCTDCAYDRTMDKFSRFTHSDGIDCRRYFGSILRSLSRKGIKNALLAEEELGHSLQRFVCHHFELSLKDCRRQFSDQSRYEWHHSRGSITLLFPKSFSGSQRRDWLESNFSGVDVNQVGSRDRIQTAIDNWFEQQSQGPVPEVVELGTENSALPWAQADGLNISNLAKQIAEEKADTILEQRPSIQKLGKSGIRNLVLRVFECIDGDSETSDTDLGKEFGLTKPSFSRFAGSAWKDSIPDLWQNTAAFVSQSSLYREALAEFKPQFANE